MDHLQTEAINPASSNLDELSGLELVRLMNAEDARVIAAVATQEQAIAQAMEIIAERLRQGGRLIYLGAGTSGRLGVLDATECPPTFNAPPGQVVGVIAGGPPALTRAVEGAEDHPELAERDLQALEVSARDVVVGIATSGRTPYVLGGVTYARKQGACTIGLACNPESDLSSLVDLTITPVVGPEVLSGSTRLKAGTATKLVLNMLSTGAMVRLGKTYGNLMVDLRATNAKLRARTNRIVRTVTGLSQDEAAALLQQCDGELKTALVSQLIRSSPDEARRRLHEVSGRVGRALRVLKTDAASAAETASGEDLLLGIDGGGTHTVALLAVRAADSADGWTLLGRGEAGPSNLQAVGREKALGALDEAVTAAFAAAQRARVPVAVACLGLAGAARLGEQQILREWAERIHLARDVDITTDAALLLASGTPEGWGLAIVAGTGSLAYGRTADGRTARAGGWGPLLGDEGSGYQIAVSALNAVTRAADGRGPETALTQALLSQLGITQLQQLVPTVYSGNWDRTALASLAPLAIAAADAGDGVADRILAEAAQSLADAAASVARQLGWKAEPLPCALAGGVMVGSVSYRQRVEQRLCASGLNPSPIRCVEEPARGAVQLALSGNERLVQ